MPFNIDEFTHSPICKVIFAGFESDTYTLQKAGWQIACNRMADRDSLYIIMHHPKANLNCMSNEVDISHIYSQAQLNGIIFTIQAVNVVYQIFNQPFSMPSASFFNDFVPVDVDPFYREIAHVSLKDFDIFLPINKTTKKESKEADLVKFNANLGTWTGTRKITKE